LPTNCAILTGLKLARSFKAGWYAIRMLAFFSSEPPILKPILLVEDDPRDLELTLVALERSQLANDVISVTDGAQALDYLLRRNDYADRAEGNPAVILLDLKLPKVNGLEVLEIVRSTEELRSVPIVMLTNSKEPVDLGRAYELGVNSYVVKPVVFQDFISAVADLGVFWAVLNEPPPGSTRTILRSTKP